MQVAGPNFNRIGEFVAHWAAHSPGAAAILAPGRSPLTYGRLREEAARLAALLRAQGIRRDDRVAVALQNGPEMAVAFLGVVSAAQCAPLNPASTAAEIEYDLTDLAVRALVSTDQQPVAIGVANRLRIPVLRLSTNPDSAAGVCEFEGPCGGSEVEPGGADDVALVLHTSGTTARPKTVPLTHRNLCASARNVRRTLQLAESDRCLNVMPLFHIHGLVAALLAPLSAGGAVVCSPGFSAADFFSWLGEFQPTWYTAVPTMHQAILARANARREAVAGHRLRLIRSSSAALAPSILQDLEAFFHAPVIEAYGMTEAAHQMASNPLDGTRKPGSVGLPAGPEIAIMDGRGTLLPAGAEGEIVIRGENVVAGYADPAANMSAFAKGWFRTGDCGHFDGDGYLFVTGRIKEIINRGGEKISPRELDEVLLRHPAVLQAVAFAVPHKQLGETVGAAVVARPGWAPAELEIREFVAARVANFKVPQVVKVVSEIPRGATGKIQRIGLAAKLGLPAIDETVAGQAAAYQPASSALEAKLVSIWSEILKRANPGIHDDFFLLGGDSFATAVLMTRLATELEVQVSLVRFLEQPTIARLAAEIARQDKVQRPSSRLIPVQPEGARPPLFCVGGHDDNPMVLGTLAKYLHPDQPVWGFAAHSLEKGCPWYRMEDLAAEYIAQMRAFQPEGPYRLVGYCRGGFVVFEMARQLHHQGVPVALLAMMDCFHPSGFSEVSRMSVAAQKLRHLRWRTAFQIRALAGRKLKDRPGYLLARGRDFIRATKARMGLAAYRWLANAGRPIPGFLCTVPHANKLALRRYAPEPYPGSAVLFRVLDRFPDAPQMGWGRMIQGGIEILDSPFHFRGMQAESTVQIMARHLQDRLDAAVFQPKE